MLLEHPLFNTERKCRVFTAAAIDAASTGPSETPIDTTSPKLPAGKALRQLLLNTLSLAIWIGLLSTVGPVELHPTLLICYGVFIDFKFDKLITPGKLRLRQICFELVVIYT
jgi:hypothetical protein